MQIVLNVFRRKPLERVMPRLLELCVAHVGARAAAVHTFDESLSERTFTTIDAVVEAGRRDGLPVEEAIRRAVAGDALGARPRKALASFLDLITGLRGEMAALPPGRLVETILRRTAFADYVQKGAPGDAASRLENLDELVTAVAAYDGLEGGLQAFLDRAALLLDPAHFGVEGARRHR